MNKLKTMNDLKGFMCRDHTCELKCHKVEHDRIRQEAIKWIKSKNTAGFSFVIGWDCKVTKYNKKKEILSPIDQANLGEMIGFINFFNITEEELEVKDEQD